MNVLAGRQRFLLAARQLRFYPLRLPHAVRLPAASNVRRRGGALPGGATSNRYGESHRSSQLNSLPVMCALELPAEVRRQLHASTAMRYIPDADDVLLKRL